MSAQKCPECGAWWAWPSEHRCPRIISTNTATITYPTPSGDLSPRVHGAEAIARKRARNCRRAALRFDKDSQQAAALRGKARGFDEAADLIRRLDKGLRLPGRDWREGA